MRRVNELNEIRQLARKMLALVVSFCNERKITYYLMNGTLLGA